VGSFSVVNKLLELVHHVSVLLEASEDIVHVQMLDLLPGFGLGAQQSELLRVLSLPLLKRVPLSTFLPELILELANEALVCGKFASERRNFVGRLG
jgi:hypothetical protein